MIHFAVYSPRVCEAASSEDVSSTICAQCVDLLRVAEEKNWVLLVDEGGLMMGATASAVKQWPEKYKKNGKELIKRLLDLHRIVPVPVKYGDDASAEVCSVAEAVAHSCQPDRLITPSRCLCSGERKLCGCDTAVSLEDFFLAPSDRRGRSSGVFAKGDNEKFKREVLAPVFRTAKWIRMVDRLIVAKASLSGLECTLPENYERGLRWVASCLAEYADKDRLSEVTIISEYPKSLNHFGKAIVKEAVTRFTSNLGEGLGLDMRVRLSSNLPHERYLVTDQLALDIGRGYDLLDRKGNLLDCPVLSLEASEFGKVVKEHPDITGEPSSETGGWVAHPQKRTSPNARTYSET